jgi:hypothetical protein
MPSELCRAAQISAPQQHHHALGALCAALERDTAAEDALLAVVPRLSDEQILWAWEVLMPVAALR